jgi:uncharacterized protein YecE (DUF72 family)
VARSRDQLDLFAPAAAPPPSPAPVPPEVAAAAARLPAGVRLGTSSWSFPGWTGIVWAGPATEADLAREGLRAYAAHPALRAVGLDRTWYAPLAPSAHAAYAAQVPDGFRFLVKADRALTDPADPRFLDPAHARDAVAGPAAEGLGEKLGVVLFQFPPFGPGAAPRPEALAVRLHRFLEALPRGPRYAVELRSAAHLGAPYASALRAAGALHAFNVHPTMPGLAAQREVVGPQPYLVVRWMLGHGRGYAEAREAYAPFDRLAAPDPAARRAIAALALEAAGAGREVLVVVNNKAEGCAPRSVVALATRLAAGEAPF